MTRLRFLAEVNPTTPEFDALPDAAEITFVPLEDVWPPPRWKPYRTRPKQEVTSGYTRLREGDVLVPKITPTFEAGRSLIAQGMDTEVAAGTTELHVVRPRRVDPRYLNYCFQSRPFLGGGEASMVGVAGQKRVPESWLLDYEVSLDDPRSQTEVADFLDGETSRIDALIEKKRQLHLFLGERRRVVIDRLLDVEHERRLRHATSRLTSGPRGWAGYTSDEGALFLRISNVRRNSIELDQADCVYVMPPADAEALRTRVLSGDVLLSITADIGSVGLARDDHEGAHVSQHIALMTPATCSGEWLAYALSTTSAQQQLDAARYGGTKMQLSLEDVADVVISLPPQSTQNRILEKVRSVVASIHATEGRLLRQVELLREHRQALITGAVTGEFNIAKTAA